MRDIGGVKSEEGRGEFEDVLKMKGAGRERR